MKLACHRPVGGLAAAHDMLRCRSFDCNRHLTLSCLAGCTFSSRRRLSPPGCMFSSRRRLSSSAFLTDCGLQKKRPATRLHTCHSCASLSTVAPAANFSEKATVKLVAIVGDDSPSPLAQASWEEVMQHTAQRLKWVNPGFEMIVVNEKEFSRKEKGFDADKGHLHQADMWIVVAVNDSRTVNRICKESSNIPNMMCFDSSPDLSYKLSGQVVQPKAPLTRILAALPGNEMKEMLQIVTLVEDAWSRRNSDDIRFVLLVLIDKFVKPVESLKNLRAQDFNTLKSMIENCSSQILACLANPNCRKAISCLNKCGPTDQVCSYRCIVSYESSELESFSLCVLQKHNCLGLTADIPLLPDVKPMDRFRAAPITHDIADDIFVGWLGNLEWSWRVVAGQNAAYDQFPCQIQIFYRGSAQGSMWYDPVFRVKTMDGRLVWRRRHYRVRRGNTPGTFHFSVLDNGVVSKEYWRIVDVTDDLSWGLFFYSGAAAAAGQSYTGAVLVTPDGNWPAKAEENRIQAALDRCGIKHWELYSVNNTSCEAPPLGLPNDAPKQITSLWR